MKDSFLKKVLGHIYLPTLLVLVFYWNVLGADFTGGYAGIIRETIDNKHWWYGSNQYWRPVWSGLTYLMYRSFGLNPLPYYLLNLLIYEQLYEGVTPYLDKINQ